MPDPVAFDDLPVIITLADTDEALINEDQGDGTFITSRITKANLALAVGDTLPVADSTAVVKGSADPLKLARFEVDGFAAPGTHVYTLPDADTTLAGLSVTQTWTADQTIDAGDNGLSLVATDDGTTTVMRVVVAGTTVGSWRIIDAASSTDRSNLTLYNDPASGTLMGVTGWSGSAVAMMVQGISNLRMDCVSGSIRFVANSAAGTGGYVFGSSASVGTNGVGVIALGNGTAPTTRPADLVQFWSADFAAGDARLFLLTESGATPLSFGNGTIGGLSIPTLSDQAANKGYVDTAVTGLFDFKGSTDCSANPNYPSAVVGDAYLVSVAGRIGGASGKQVDVGDLYIASAVNAGGTEASVGTSWFVIEHNVLALGTAAFVNTGLSGATIPLLSTSNTWTTTQLFDRINVANSVNITTFGTFVGVSSNCRFLFFSGRLEFYADQAHPATSPAQIAANVDDYVPGTGLFQRWSSDASRNVTGMTGGTDGVVREIWNVGSFNIVLVHDATSTAANRFLCPSSANFTLLPGKGVEARYDATASRWRLSVLSQVSFDNPGLWTAQQNFSIATLTSSAGSIAWNLNAAQSAIHTFTENTTLANPTNMVNGGTYVLRLVQHASSPKTLAFGSAYKWPGGSVPTITATNGAVDIITFVSDGTNMYGTIQQAFA